MGEQLTLQVGHCGCQLGLQFWNELRLANNLSLTGHSTAAPDSRLFTESLSSHYQPNTLFIDTCPETLTKMQHSDLGKFLGPFLTGSSSTNNQFGAGYFNQHILMNKVINELRKKSEKCDKLKQFQIIQALGGGTGSGTGSKMVEMLRENYSCSIKCCQVFPQSGYCLQSPNNCVLGVSKCLDCQMTWFDNQQLFTQFRSKNALELVNEFITKSITESLFTSEQQIQLVQANTNEGDKIEEKNEIIKQNKTGVRDLLQTQLDQFQIIKQLNARKYSHTEETAEMYDEAFDKVQNVIQQFSSDIHNMAELQQ
ncbi:Beta-tubulin_2 [Hexamita inflata]|uniref:Beta-tubulin 2 n=1 Tax=Hexamita inflata TaxID=28002 RepID=A0AA86NXR0_9EUKA|nr:Beta-tubulin 2 [Hexamita inflata]